VTPRVELDAAAVCAHNVAVAQLSQLSTVGVDAEQLAAVAERVEIAARALLTLSARASIDLPGSVSLTQLRALAAAEELGACSLGALADALRISTSSASRLVDRLSAAGVLDRRPSDVSRRELTLQVTPRGKRLLRRHEASRRAVFAEALNGMASADVRALVRGLEAVQHHLAGDDETFQEAE
jgi:DNA-binding MarR family transcriptional regulator